MRIGIIGSRRRKDKKAVFELVASFPPDTIVISGGCAGPDLFAEEAAKSAGLKTNIYLPDLPPPGSPKHEFTKAFYARNKLIAENSDIIHAFVAPDRKGGTENTIQYAYKLKIPVIIH